MHEINTEDGQDVGRIVNTLGDRNMLLFCNDGKERICHIRGGLSKKSGFLDMGDIVLYSLRSEGGLGGSAKDRGDILAKYERELHHQLKKLSGINPNLFVDVENVLRKNGAPADQDGFVFENESEDEELLSEKNKDTEKNRTTAEVNGGSDSDDFIDAI